MKTLYLIPARGGSVRIPDKNIREVNGKPLLHYSIEYARLFAGDEDICLSTESEKVVACAAKIGLSVPFYRPKELATSEATSESVMVHALNFYISKGVEYDTVVLLQPTSPIRLQKHLEEAMVIYTDSSWSDVKSTNVKGALNGSLYIHQAQRLLSAHPGSTLYYPMAMIYSVDIDEISDIHSIEQIFKNIDHLAEIADYGEFES